MEHAADIDLRRQARVANEDPSVVIRRWLGRGWRDLRAHWGVSLAYGFGFLLLGWMTVLVLALTGLGWMILPAIAGAMLLGPAATVGLYRISRRAQGMGGRGIAAPGQITLVGVVMMTLALLWIRAATLLFAVFFGLRPFAGFLETLHALFFSWEGIALIMIGTCVGGLFAAFDFKLMLIWAVIVTALVTLCVLTGLIAAVIVFPWLGYVTWHAYVDLFEDSANGR